MLIVGICLMVELPCCYKRKNMLLRLEFITCWDGALIRTTSFTQYKSFHYSFKFLSALLSLIYCTTILGSTLSTKQTQKYKHLDFRQPLSLWGLSCIFNSYLGFDSLSSFEVLFVCVKFLCNPSPLYTDH